MPVPVMVTIARRIGCDVPSPAKTTTPPIRPVPAADAAPA
jgi:hypothetical protein